MKKVQPQKHFTIGINDDVTHASLEYDPSFSIEDPHTARAMFYGGVGSPALQRADADHPKEIEIPRN